MNILLIRSIAALASVLVWLLGFSDAHAVEYEATFNGLWDPSHSTSYPANAHFTEMVGATHTQGTDFWRAGGLASNGVEDVAELGVITAMLQELSVAEQSNTAGPAIVFESLFNLPRSSTVRFDIEVDKPFITLITMIAPSPDWFVGVSGLSLRAGDRWIENLIIPLRAYDAGTEQGNTFSLNNLPTNPADPIAPFSGAPFNGRPTLGTLSFRLLTPQPPPENDTGYLPGIISTVIQ